MKLAAAITPLRRGLWRNPDFLRFWAGETISLFGSQITTMALPLAAILTLDATPAQLGVISAMRFLPFLLLTLLAGVWVDRVRRRPLLIGANLGRGVVIGLVPLIAWLGHLRIEHLYAAALVLGVLTMIFDLAYQSFLPSLVSREHLLEGNSKLLASASSAEIGGPGLAGLLVQAVGAPFALAADATSFFISAFSLASIRTQESAPDHGQKLPGPVQRGDARHSLSALWVNITGGLRLTFANPFLRAVAGEAATYNLLGTIVETLTALYAVRYLGLSPGLLGLTISLGSVGSLLGSLLAGRAAQRWGTGTALVGSMVLASTMPLLIPLATGSRALVMAFLTASFFLGGIGLAASNVYVGSLRQTLTLDHLLGRVNASYRFLIYAGIPLGALLGGLAGQVLGPRTALFMGASALTLAPLWVVFSPVWRLTDLRSAGTLQPLPASEAPL